MTACANMPKEEDLMFILIGIPIVFILFMEDTPLQHITGTMHTNIPIRILS